jgi:KDO2-lipid IV(A) lauroyltransferase
MTIVQRVQSIKNSPIFTFGLERLPRGRGYYLHVEPIKETLSLDPMLAAAQMNVAMENMIRKMPTQYLWGYRRYKEPKLQSLNQTPKI